MSEEIVPLRKGQKKGLGRGLGSLLGEVAGATENEQPSSSPAHATKPQVIAPTPSVAPVEVNLKETADSVVKPSIKTEVISHQAPQPPQVAQKAQPTVVHVPETERIWKVAIEKVNPNKEQPRKIFDPIKLQELAASIKEKGILMPIVVKKLATGTFEIIAGERRWRAAQQAGLHEVPVILKAAENREALELGLIENIQRQDLNPMEEAEAYSVLAGKYGLTQQQIADKVSKERSTIANMIRLTLLTAEVKKLVRSGELQMGQAKVLLAVEDPHLQVQLAKKIVQQRLSVRATERLIVRAKESEAKALDLEADQLSQREIQPLISELQRLLGTKVDISLDGQRSKVSIHFYSVPELNQFVESLRKSKQ